MGAMEQRKGWMHEGGGVRGARDPQTPGPQMRGPIGDPQVVSPPHAERNAQLKREVGSRPGHLPGDHMARCRHHSGYLADDEASHSMCSARVQLPKKPLVPEMRPACKPGRVPHPPSTCGSSALQGQRRNKRHPQPFGHFLDFLTESQVLDSLETVVEKATERMAAMKTEAGVPLVEVQDPVEVPSGGRRAHARPSLSTVHRHRVRPTLCTGHPNNYPSSSSSMSNCHSSLMAGCLGSHSRDSDLGAQGSLPPVRDKLLLEKNLKRLLQLEREGSPCSSSRFTKKKPLPSISSKSSMSHFSNRLYEELADFLTQQAASLVIRKYEFEKDLSKQLGFFSFPITHVLRDLSLGLKKVKGSRIHLSSETHRSCLLRKLEESKRARQASRLSTSHCSTETPSVQQEPATHTAQDQATEPCRSLYTNLPASRQLSPLEPKLYMSACTGMGSSPPKSKDMDNEGRDKAEIEDEDEDEFKDEDQDEDKDEDGV
ncbi:coiled-coil domain-containing protein 116 isoform X4 [Homo sapiens]|uniref:coiled-coil domain-containing protein 116 isoform X4 n=1 Tax=Homo sapiens TaxID=9606 RepID=UPI0000E06C10|nr:coiled-coil domain-containing protein 116 isoform X4 [Homo sapiens]|eukprot:XP_011528287.1 coiled-coil domain-containing protein 116 isoform X3 [Homo sapiens]